MRNNLLTENEVNRKYLLAFSGGPDSVYLLLQLHLLYKSELNKHISIVYINYHDSKYVDREETIVMHYCKLYNLQLYKQDVVFPKRKNLNFEEWARKYRYHLFKKIVKEDHFDALLTAHQRTDVIETYLLQKQRNNLPLYYGLKRENVLLGMKVLRPLLYISKKELTDELDSLSLPYYDDITNKNLKKKRNYIRSELNDSSFPSIEKEIEAKNKYISDLYTKFSSYKSGMSFKEYTTLNEEEKRRYSFYLLDILNIKREREKLGKFIFDFLKKHDYGSLSLAKGYVLYRKQDSFFIYEDISKINYSYVFSKARKYRTKYFDIDLSDITKFNLKKLPVTVRNNKENDCISTDYHIKEVKKFLDKQGVPNYLQPLYPVFIVDSEIVCVPFYIDIKKKKIPFAFKFD